MLLSSSHGLPWTLTPLATDRPSRRALAQPLPLPHLGGCPAPRDHVLRFRIRPGTRRRAVHRHHCSPRRFFVWTAPSTTHDRFDHSAGTITTTREPHCVVGLVVGDVEEGLSARFVIASKMSVRSKALRVENDLRRPSALSQR